MRWNGKVGAQARVLLLGILAWTAAGLPGHAQAPDAFKDAAAVWQKVQSKLGQLDKVVEEKKLESVHEAAFAIRDLVKTLPPKSKALPAEGQKKLATGVKTVGQLAKLLDKYGDANDLAKTQEQQKKMHTVLAAIEGLYPAGALKK